jgi:predicted ribonuclease YlaK
MRKIFILDTNVLLHDPNAIFKFEDNELIVPIDSSVTPASAGVTPEKSGA